MTMTPWVQINREVAAAKSFDLANAVSIIGGPVHLRARHAFEAIADGSQLIVLQAPAAISASQARALVNTAVRVGSTIVEPATGLSIGRLPGLGTGGSPEMEKAISIACLGSLATLFPPSTSRRVHNLHLWLLDNIAPVVCALRCTGRDVAIVDAPNGSPEPWWIRMQEPGPDAQETLVKQGCPPCLATLRNSAERLWSELAAKSRSHDAEVTQYCSGEKVIENAADIERLLVSYAGRQRSTSRPRPAATIVGSGRAASLHAGAAAVAGSVSAVVSRTMAGAQSLASVYSAEAAIRVTPAMLASSDVVVIAGPPALHAALSAEALAAGVPTLVEKPLAATLSDARSIVQQATSGGVRLMYGENWLYRVSLRDACARAGETKPRRVHVTAEWPQPQHGAYGTVEWGGGVLFDVGSHALALCRMIRGRLAFDRVECTFGSTLDVMDVDTRAAVTLHSLDGSRYSLQLSWSARRPRIVAIGDAFLLDITTRRLTIAGTTVDIPDSQGLFAPWEEGGLLSQHRMLSAPGAFPSASEGVEDLEIITAAYASAGAGGEPRTFPYQGPPGLTPIDTYRLARQRMAEERASL